MKNAVPTPPSVTGLSKRLLMSIVAAIFFIVSALVIVIAMHAPSNEPAVVDTPVEQPSLVNTERAIEQLMHQQRNRNEERPMPSMGEYKEPIKKNIMGLAEEEFKLAVNSPMSVYTSSQSQLTSTDTDKSFNESKPSDYHHGLAKDDKQQAFLNQAQQNTGNTHIDTPLQKAGSPYSIKAGSVLPATLQTAIQSDLPGTILARIRRNVFDTVTGNHLLIPQGTLVIGQYDSNIVYGQSRLLVVWSRLIFPNGESMELQGQPGVDLTGQSGFHDKVNHHMGRLFGSSMMVSLIGAAGQLSQPPQQTDTLTRQQVAFGAVGEAFAQTSTQLLAKNMNIQPTITIREGALVNVLLTKDITFPKPMPV